MALKTNNVFAPFISQVPQNYKTQKPFENKKGISLTKKILYSTLSTIVGAGAGIGFTCYNDSQKAKLRYVPFAKEHIKKIVKEDPKWAKLNHYYSYIFKSKNFITQYKGIKKLISNLNKKLEPISGNSLTELKEKYGDLQYRYKLLNTQIKYAKVLNNIRRAYIDKIANEFGRKAPKVILIWGTIGQLISLGIFKILEKNHKTK